MGWSGCVLATHLRALGVHVAGTVRDLASAPHDGLLRHQLRADATPSPALLGEIAQAEAVLCSVPPDAEGDPALRLLLPALQESPALHWVGYLSSTSVYADRAGGWVDERSAADATEAAGVQRLRAEAQWRALAEERGVASAVFRLPGLYGPGRNALLQLAQGRARHVVRPGLVFNRLHVDDLATVVIASMQRPCVDGLYLPADDEPAPPQQVLAFAAQLGGFAMPPAVAWDDPVLSPTLRRFYESSKRIDSRGTREALGWQPRFPSYREGLRDLLR
ncbi:epimerase [Stenotrophomonas maltophilia]|uniref:Epimerase n=2 Tax=Stenotrophomonas TaxID=40323 RepID=A0AAI9C367_STEMA|nr:epimerase [Stenotrophomonas maltophilia]EKT4093318.1 epimerase [Stenotrophomonas maltophilia]HEL4103616.1 epimerase [Stenotrophomonas maltophilia]HEL5044226.1 epimerase [Stenotrophomonas maltophilia]